MATYLSCHFFCGFEPLLLGLHYVEFLCLKMQCAAILPQTKTDIFFKTSFNFLCQKWRQLQIRSLHKFTNRNAYGILRQIRGEISKLKRGKISKCIHLDSYTYMLELIFLVVLKLVNKNG
jgi:hypothetical protein